MIFPMIAIYSTPMRIVFTNSSRNCKSKMFTLSVLDILPIPMSLSFEPKGYTVSIFLIQFNSMIFWDRTNFE